MKKGYPKHYWYAMGHMAEAEDELQQDFPDLAESVRACRKAWEANEHSVPRWGRLIVMIATGAPKTMEERYRAQRDRIMQMSEEELLKELS
jgi:predicted metal-dependent phosphoesterase TrpH